MEIVQEMYNANTDHDYRVYVNQGGTSSSKTYTILQVLIVQALNDKRSISTVVGQDMPNLKVGAWRDTKNIIGDDDFLTKKSIINESTHTILFANGSLIEFKSYEDEQDAKSGKRDYLFINEANGITYEVYWQLAIRTKKKIWIDYNPNERFWVHDKIIGLEGVKLIISDFHFNPFLPADMAERIANIQDEDLRQVYTYGLTGKLEGLIIRNYSIVDSMPEPHECKVQGFGLDFGFSCFRGDTLIATSNGMKPISMIERGELVLTSCGYRRVRKRIYNGRKKVIHKRFVFDDGVTDIYCTEEHLFKSNGKWKKYGQLTKEDNLFTLSLSTGFNSNDIPVENIPTTITTNGNQTESIAKNYCTMPFISSIMEKSRNVVSSITEMGIRSIMTLRTSLRSLRLNTPKSIKTYCGGTMSIPKNTQKDSTQNQIGISVGRKSSSDLQTREEYASGVEKNTHQQTHISGFAQNNVITDGNTKAQTITLNGCAHNAERHSTQASTRTQYVAPMNAHINLQKPTDLLTIDQEFCDVWDLEVEDVHEYFANGILVHNCDPTALVHCALAHGELWVDCFVYETGLLNPDIANRIKAHPLSGLFPVVADSAEPKSIAEIKAQRVNIIPAVKGNDSIRVGIDIMRRYKWNITRRSRGLIDEVQRYKWKTNRSGDTTNEPIDSWNHAIDAIRYWCLRNLAQRRESASKAHSVIVG